MNFAIEVPGEASPLSLQELCRTLQLASTSLDYAQRQSAGQQLASWEPHPDYYPLLQLAFLDKSLPREIRLLAIIQLKNGIDKHWRHHTIQNAIQPPQKETIRSSLYRGSIGEEDKQLALHNALVVAKVTRIDFPQAWPEAMSNLVSLLRETKDGDASQLAGALVILLRVVKELGTARLRKSQSALQSVTPELVYLLGEIYTGSTAAWISFWTNGGGEEHAAALAMQNSLAAFKTLRRLLVVGYEYPHKDSAVQQAWSLSQAQLGQFLGFVSHGSPIPPLYLENVGKHLMQFTKLHLEMAQTHPASFASLPNSFELVRSYWELVAKFAEVFNKSGGLRQGPMEDEAKFKVEGPLLEKLALKGLLLCRACIKMVNQPTQTFRYRSKEARSEQDDIIGRVKNDLLKDEFIVQMANVIISHLLVFREADLAAWEENPEEWEQQEETQGSAWEWEVRPCAENVLNFLLVSYKHLLIQPLLAYFETARNPQADIMAKESVYTALGLAASHLDKQFDFNEFLKSTLVSDAQQRGPLCKVLRRRIGILISQWVPVGISKDSRPLVYEIYRHFLSPSDQNNDIVVRITAARQFKMVADDFAFEGGVFAPFAQGILTELIELLHQTDIDETKLAILDTTKAIIERMETYVNPFADLIVSALPAIWESGSDLGYMLKQAVLTILQSLVMSMRQESQRFHVMTVPLIADSVREGSDVFVYLIDESLELWINILHQSSPPLSQELLSLVEPALRLLGEHTEHHLMYLTIAGSYLLLAPQFMLEDRWRQSLLKGLSETYSLQSQREQQNTATRYIEYVIRYAEELGKLDGLKVVIGDMMSCGILPHMFEGIHDAYTAHQTSGPKRKTPKVNNLTLTDYFSVLSRIAVVDPTIFVEMLASLGPLDQVWNWLSAEWFANLDCISNDPRRKLNLLGLTRLMELGQPMQDLVLAKLQDYFTMWTSVITPLLDDENPTQDLLVLTEALETTEWDTPKELSERALRESDPVSRVNSLSFVRETLAGFVQRVGGEQTFQETYAVNIDSDVLASYQKLGQARDPGS
ncbi:importin-beta domain-containing protein [Seiridium cupressi]|uniref:Importin 11 n=1 Tax=Seiridium unicorne TaxID=138068 RepID=A0ABR2UK22_9PEZI